MWTLAAGREKSLLCVMVDAQYPHGMLLVMCIRAEHLSVQARAGQRPDLDCHAGV